MTDLYGPRPLGEELDWSATQAAELGAKVVELWTMFLADLSSLPVARPSDPSMIRRALVTEIPDKPMSMGELLGLCRTLFYEYSTHTGHPNFMGYIMGAGTVPAAAAELLATALNQNVGGWEVAPGATEIEIHLMSWFAKLFGLPASACGLLTAGGALANLTALKVARDKATGWRTRVEGLSGGARLTLYVSEEGHVTIDRAVDLLGLGGTSVRRVPTDEHYRMDVHELLAMILSDREAGLSPFAIVGTAGTTATGALDPLMDIGMICKQQGMWFHIDAAYGGALAIVDSHRHLLKGSEMADSITFDPHKWLYMPAPAGGVLFRQLAEPVASFGYEATYTYEDKGQTGAGLDLSDLGPQWSRSFSAFKVWFSLLAHGRQAFANRILRDIELTNYLAQKVEQHPNLELVVPCSLSVCCFRFIPTAGGARPAPELNELNRRLLTEIHLDGRVFCSNAVVRGQFALRTCIVNFRTSEKDVDRFLDVVVEIGKRLEGLSSKAQ